MACDARAAPEIDTAENQQHLGYFAGTSGSRAPIPHNITGRDISEQTAYLMVLARERSPRLPTCAVPAQRFQVPLLPPKPARVIELTRLEPMSRRAAAD